MMGWVKYEPFNLQTAVRWSPIAAFFCFMLVSSFCSMHYMNVPMVRHQSKGLCFQRVYLTSLTKDIKVIVFFNVFLNFSVNLGIN